MMLSLRINRISRNSASFLSQFKCLSDQAGVATNWENAKPLEQIPGPNILQFCRFVAPGGKYYDLPLNELVTSFRRDYGSISKFPAMFGRKSLVMTFRPEDIEAVLRTEGKFPHRLPLDSMEYFRKKHRPDLYPAGAGLTITQGQEWYDFRSKVQQVLMQPRSTKIYVPGIDGVARDFVAKIRKIRDANCETPVNFFETMNEWALESIGLIAFDTRLGVMDNPRASELNQLIKNIFEITFKYDMQPSIWRLFKTPGFKKALKVYEKTALEIKQYVMAAVDKYEKNPTADEQESGVLEKLIKVDKNVGIAMAEDMLFAGVDTTSSAMTAVLYNLAKNPDKQEILHQEILKILPDKDSKLTSASFNSVPYMRAVIKESLRVNPLIRGIVRRTGQDLVFQGYRIHKGTDVLLSNSTLSLDEEHYKKSDKFIPERWLKDNTDPQCPHAKDAHPFTYMPFGFGTRMCVGRRLAELEIEVLTARILREFRVEWNHPDLKFKSITINLPDGPLKFKMIDI